MNSATAGRGASTPVLHLQGLSPRDRGAAHGEHLRELIHVGVRQWIDELESAHGRSIDEVVDGLLSRTNYLKTVGRHAPELLDEVSGIADGANIDFKWLFAYNLWDEERLDRDGGEHCSTLGVRRGSSGVPISGQNMDLVQLPIALLYLGEGSDAQIVLTLAGMVGLLGVNAHGLAVLVNAVHQLPWSPNGLPVAFMIRSALSQATLQSAAARIRSLPHAIGQNYLLASAEGLISLECSSRECRELPMHQDVVLHTNHPVVLAARQGTVAGESSTDRYDFLVDALPLARSSDDLQRLLADRSVPVCKVLGPTSPDTETIWSIIVEHHQGDPRILLAPGPPDRTEWYELHFRDLEGKSDGEIAGQLGALARKDA